MYINRREFIKISALGVCSLVISTGLSGCNNGDDAVIAEFLHGVASGDPLSDRVIIWTRATTDASEANINYEVATDSLFKNIIHNGFAKVDVSTDYTLKVDITNLAEDTKYYYRFSSGENISTTGAMKTLSSGDVAQVKMAVFSCANYPNGYFNAYTEASMLQDLDVSIHLGDYIYEYGMYKDDDFEAKIPAYATKDAITINRVLPDDNNTECITLDNYRKRYAIYRTDKGLQALHAACPMIAVWDDHEVANDTYANGADNHDQTEGEFDTRVEAAIRAYFEWLPIRPIENKKEIYRSFDFGNLVSLHMLETRLLSRTKQLSYANYFAQDGSFLVENFQLDITDASRTMVGDTQFAWLAQQFSSSYATWQVLGQQVLMGRMNLPSELLVSISKLEYANDEEKVILIEQINTSFAELATIKVRYLQGDTTLTDADKARINTVLPYNLDAWDGYFYEREILFETVKNYAKNFVVLSGDTHNSWANTLKDMNGNKVGIELAATSVTSPGMEEYLSITSLEQAMQAEGAIELLVDDLEYCNLMDRGFVEVVFTKDSVTSNWHYIDNYHSTEYSINHQRGKSVSYLAV